MLRSDTEVVVVAVSMSSSGSTSATQYNDSGMARGPPAHNVRRAAVRKRGPALRVAQSTYFPNDYG